MKQFFLLTFLMALCLSSFCSAANKVECVDYSSLTDYLTKTNQTEGLTGHLDMDTPYQAVFYTEFFKRHPEIRLIGETGFNGGHSSEIFLSKNPDAKVVSFELCLRPCVLGGRKYLNDVYPGRLSVIIGDSKKTVPDYANKNPQTRFDLIFIDGGHDEETIFLDIVNMKRLSHTKTLLIVDDLWERGPTIVKAWNRCINKGIIRVLETYPGQFPAPGFGVAMYNFE